jgi:hypothetical protein
VSGGLPLTYLQIDFIKFSEELAIQQVASSDFVVGRQLLPNQSWVDFVNGEDDSLGNFSDVLVRMIDATAAALGKDSAAHPALLLLIDALTQHELLEHLHSAQSQPGVSAICDGTRDARRNKVLLSDLVASGN